MKRTVDLNREGNRRGAKHYLSRELRWMEPYARDLPGSAPLISELVLLMHQAEDELDPRLRKELRMGSMMRMSANVDHRSRPRASVREMLEGNAKP